METREITYENAMKRLEEIAEAMNAASVPLDELMDLYEEGMGLASHCEKLLKGYEARLEKVSKQALMRETPEDVDVFGEPDIPEEEVPF